MSYTSTKAFLGLGITLGYCTTSGGTYTNFAEILKVSGPKVSARRVKATNAQSTAEEFIGGVLNSGDVDFDANMTDTDYSAIMGDPTASPSTCLVGLTQFFKITLPNKPSGGTSGTIIAFKGFIEEISPEVQVEDKSTHKIKICVTGPVTRTAAV
jgi:hypothetical protein